MMLRSGAAIGEDKGKKPEEDTWVRKALAKQPEIDLAQAKETLLEAKKIFAEASTSGSKGQAELEQERSFTTTFLETCMKLLRDANAVKGLQELITRCDGADKPRLIHKLGKCVLRTG